MNKEEKQSRPIGRKVRELREKQGLTIKELAEEVGISRSYLSHIELESSRDPSVGTILKIAEALDTSVADLLGEEEKSRSTTSSSFNSPFTTSELEEMAESDESSEDYILVEGLSQESKEALHLFKEILNDPEIPMNKINKIRDEMVSHAKWLRAKAKDEVPGSEDDH